MNPESFPGPGQPEKKPLSGESPADQTGASPETASAEAPPTEAPKPSQESAQEVPTRSEMTRAEFWEQLEKTAVGKELVYAMEGRQPDGKQDVAGRLRIVDYSMREFVRRHPEEARQYAETFKEAFGQELRA